MNYPRRFKYVIYDDLFPRLCTEADKHSTIAPHGATSAGFASLSFAPDGALEVSCFGESVGLGLKSKGEKDAELIRRMFVERY